MPAAFKATTLVLLLVFGACYERVPDCFEAREALMARLGAVTLNQPGSLRVGQQIVMMPLGESFTLTVERITPDSVVYSGGQPSFAPLVLAGFAAVSHDDQL